MKALAIVVGIIFAAGVLVAACTALVNDDDNSLGRVELVSHHYDDGGGGGYDDGGEEECDRDWNGGDCGGDSYRNEYGRGKNGDQGRAGRDQCHSFCNNVIVVPDPTKEGGGGGNGDEQPRSVPASLFPPTPDGIRTFVTQTIMAGIEMGRLFADTTITFVSNLLVGIA